MVKAPFFCAYLDPTKRRTRSKTNTPYSLCWFFEDTFQNLSWRRTEWKLRNAGPRVHGYSPEVLQLLICH